MNNSIWIKYLLQAAVLACAAMASASYIAPAGYAAGVVAAPAAYAAGYAGAALPVAAGYAAGAALPVAAGYTGLYNGAVAYNGLYNGAIAYDYNNDLAGQVYPLAEPYVDVQVAAEEENPAAELYIHEETAAEPYIHEEIAAEHYVHVEPLPPLPLLPTLLFQRLPPPDTASSIQPVRLSTTSSRVSGKSADRSKKCAKLLIPVNLVLYFNLTLFCVLI